MAHQTVPDLSYEKAMNSSIKIPVRECDAEVFALLIEHAVQTAKRPEKAREALQGLQWDSMIDRWYALNSLQEMGVALPIGG